MGRAFYKMTGSGNDFVFFDARTVWTHEVANDARAALGEEALPDRIARICRRGTGVGADGVVFLLRSDPADIGIRYYNADGSLASLCGNATLCTTNLAVRLGAVDPRGFTIATDAGIVQARIRNGLPQFDLPAASDLVADFTAIDRMPGERRIGYVTAGVPHVVIQVDDLDRQDIVGRGRPIRYTASVFPDGTNVNFVSQRPDGSWAIRTYERGVEDETLACGTGNAAAGILLSAWGEIDDRVELLTRSGQVLDVGLCRDGGAWLPSLRGEGRLVFRGELDSL